MIVGEVLEPRIEPEVDPALESRILRTLAIANRWGYGLTAEEVARLLYGGPEHEEAVRGVLRTSRALRFRDGVATLEGREDLVEKSVSRRRSNGTLTSAYFAIAEEFARDLLRHSPFVRAVAISGSAASGGLRAGDDVDLNLFAEDGSKYVVYLTALVLGVKASLRHARRLRWGTAFLGILPKVTCVNVVWTERDCRPFVRQDAYLAFEILRSIPIAGSAFFGEVLRANPWLSDHFPQVFAGPHPDRVDPPDPSRFARLQARAAASPRRRRWMDWIARSVAFALHRIVEVSRGRDPAARARIAFLRHVKFPYEVFQD